MKNPEIIEKKRIEMISEGIISESERINSFDGWIYSGYHIAKGSKAIGTVKLHKNIYGKCLLVKTALFSEKQIAKKESEPADEQKEPEKKEPETIQIQKSDCIKILCANMESKKTSFCQLRSLNKKRYAVSMSGYRLTLHIDNCGILENQTFYFLKDGKEWSGTHEDSGMCAYRGEIKKQEIIEKFIEFYDRRNIYNAIKKEATVDLYNQFQELKKSPISIDEFKKIYEEYKETA